MLQEGRKIIWLGVFGVQSQAGRLCHIHGHLRQLQVLPLAVVPQRREE